MSALDDAVARISTDVAAEIAALSAAIANGTDPTASIAKLNALSDALEASVAPPVVVPPVVVPPTT